MSSPVSKVVKRLPQLMALVALAWCLVTGSVAHASDDPRRKVVVLEYRAGSAELPNVPERITLALASLTSLKIIDLNGARQTFGPSLDRTVAKCAGEAACLATVGRKIGADEIVLVGISELGDIILTLQRIDVKVAGVTTRIAESLAPDESPTDDQLAQYLARVMPSTDFIRFGTIRIVANEAGAAVTVGGERRGDTPIEPLRVLAPGSYDIKVEKRGFVAFRAVVAVPADGEVAVNADLSRVGAGSHWYQKWWILAAAGVVVAGATGTAIWLATRADDRVPVTGTF